jgi:hypothetical protein
VPTMRCSPFKGPQKATQCRPVKTGASPEGRKLLACSQRGGIRTAHIISQRGHPQLHSISQSDRHRHRRPPRQLPALLCKLPSPRRHAPAACRHYQRCRVRDRWRREASLTNNKRLDSVLTRGGGYECTASIEIGEN